MTFKNTAAALALITLALCAHAGRDEALIKQTRKNQLAHDAAVKKAQQQQQQQKK